MRSAIYYPSTHISSPALMHSSLLLWDKLNVIVPEAQHPIHYADPGMAKAWELLGGKIVPSDKDKWDAHDRIKQMLEAGIARDLGAGEQPLEENIIELWPEKLDQQTWGMLQRYNLTGRQLANGDYAFSDQAGTAVMAKIADACAGNAFARVTDRFLAYGLIADSNAVPADATAVVPMTLDLIDPTRLPLERLIDFRRRETREQRGGDYAAMRHRYADAVQKHVDAIKGIASESQRAELNRQFGDDMARDLKELSDALRVNRAELLLKPVVVATVVGAGTFLTGGLAGPAALIAAGSAALGTSLIDSAKHVAELFSSGLGFSSKQKEAMSKHPMAYMYALSRA